MKTRFLTILVVCSCFASFSKDGFTAMAPLCLIENKGQITDQYFNKRDDIDFKVSGGSIMIFVGKGQMHYQFTGNSAEDHFAMPDEKERKFDIYRMDVELLGCNKNAVLVLENKQEYYQQYYTAAVGPDGAIANSYTKATYKEIYPGIDWVIYIKGEKIETEFVAEEGADISLIRQKYSGATSLRVNKDGSFSAVTPFGAIREAAPYCYVPGGVAVSSAFALDGDVLSFSVAGYTGRLVIDPAIEWATYYRGNLPTTVVNDMALYGPGNIYMCGTTLAEDLATVGVHQETFSGNNLYDAFLVRFDSSGNRVWATYFGGTTYDHAYGVSCDPAGYIYLSGGTVSDNNIASPNAYQLSRAGSSDAFLAKFNDVGQRIWSTYYGGSLNDGETSMLTVDSSYGIYIAGSTLSANNIASPGAHQLTLAGDGDVFIAKFDSSGNRVWGTYYGGNDIDFPGMLLTDNAGSLYICGHTSSMNNIATPLSHQPAFTGTEDDAFLAKFDTAGTLLWATYYGGDSSEMASALAIDGGGHVYLAGTTGVTTQASSNNIATPGSFQQAPAGASDIFLVKFNSNGERIWGTYYGGSNSDIIYLRHTRGIAVDSAANIYMTGSTNSATGIATLGAWQPALGGGAKDAFVTKFDSAGNRIWASYFGGEAAEDGKNCVWDGMGHLYVTGITTSLTNIATTGAFITTNIGGASSFLTRISDCQAAPPLITQAGNILSTGIYAGYQWYMNGNIIPGATQQTYQATQPGDYTVMVTDINGCMALSTPLPVNVKDITSKNGVFIYPNPAQKEVYITSAEAVSVILLDNVGRVVYSNPVANNKHHLTLNHLAKGIYIIKMTGENGSVHEKIVLE